MKLFNMYHFWKYALVRPTQWRPTQWMDWVEAPKHFPKPHLQEKNVMVNTRTNPLQLSESHRNYCIWGSCSANQQDAPKTARLAASIGPQKGSKSSPWQCPTAHHATNTSKVEQVELWCFASSTIFTWPLVNRLPLVRASWWLFTGKTLPQPAGCKKSCPRVHHIPKHGLLLLFFCYRNKQTYFSLAKMCWF